MEEFFERVDYLKICVGYSLKNAGNFDYANDEYVKRAPVVSHELDEALKHDEIDLAKVKGYVWMPFETAENPFKDYVEEFYKLKQGTQEDDPSYQMFKLLLNSLYGKTYQTVRQTDYEEEPEFVWNEQQGRCVRNSILYRAGGIYLPHVGSWITSMCRATLHDNLHQNEAIDCATDSFKTTRSDVPTGPGLGELKHQHQGLLLLIRPKLYVMFSDEIQKEVMGEFGGDLRGWLKKNINRIEEHLKAHPEDVWKFFPKYALHGFWGSVIELLKLYRDKSNEYLSKHMTKTREAIRQNKQARIMETRPRRLGINWDEERGKCGLKVKDAFRQMDLCTTNCSNCAYAKEF